jgi:hypothetical protein
MSQGSSFDSLSGFWTGVYDYPGNAEDAVPFNALLIEVGGALSGEITEPNSFSSSPVSQLYAKIAGSRSSSSVSFIKTYEKVKEGGHQIHYEGIVDDALTKIEGMWTDPGFPSWSGPFILNRSGHASEKIKTEIREEILAKK